MKPNFEHDSEKFYRHLLCRYLPHRTVDIKPYDTTYEHFFKEGSIMVNKNSIPVGIIVEENQRKFEPFSDRFEHLFDIVQENRNCIKHRNGKSRNREKREGQNSR
jgi:hypothetical protein